MLRIKKLTIEQIVILLFSILPVIDSVNGILITRGLPSIGIVYKFLVLGILLVFTLRRGAIAKGLLLGGLIAIGYIVAVIVTNVAVFSAPLQNGDFAVKLIFNILTLIFLLNLLKTGFLSGKSIYTMLHINCWLMAVMILVPYALGLGYTIYSGGVGYKGFFFSNNELSVALIILFYFSLYRVAVRLSAERIALLLLTMVCVLLLNTKSGMAACLLGGGLFVAEYLLRKDTKYKGLVIAAVLMGLLVTWSFIAEQIRSFMTRQTYLYNLYGGSMLDTIVSGRTFYLEKAWTALMDSPATAFHLLLGNGFCSDILVEMDFIDIFFYLGALGVAALCVMAVWGFLAAGKNFRRDRTKVLAIGYLTILGFSFLAGHTLFMATSGCYFVLYLCLCLTYFSAKKES